MKCQHKTCDFDTDWVIEAKSKVREHMDMKTYHVQADHAPAQPVPTLPSTASGGKKTEKFPRSTVGLDETSEKWDDLDTVPGGVQPPGAGPHQAVGGLLLS